MLFIPGALVSLLTFPGVILHELAHKLFCDWTGVKVHEVKYFKFRNVLSLRSGAAGWVIHEAPATWAQTFWISVGPLVVNSFVCIVLAFLHAQAQPDSFLAYLLSWIAICVGMHAFPSDHDAANVLVHSKQSLTDGGSFFHYLTYPFFWIIWLANKLRVFWFDFIYAMALFYVGSSL